MRCPSIGPFIWQTLSQCYCSPERIDKKFSFCPTCRLQVHFLHYGHHHRQEVHRQRCFLHEVPIHPPVLHLKFWKLAYRWNKSLHAWNAARVKPISVAPEIHAVVEPTNMILNAFPIAVTMALLVCAWVARRAEIPVFTCPSSRPYCWTIIAVHTSAA